ncbi:F-box protein At5g49610-like [Abrus precatorius]|uniref:F-box protein At5g49610-like n=1 Tax=Abrus precatorius TaxID=3816 RepID=A0A8B8LSG3_ABRPR|nr:F-box protein At5g49610-like [Abrus precatorius]
MKKVHAQSHWLLNSDILFDILSRIPVKDLLGLKCVSKEWHGIISSRSFSIAQLGKNRELFLTGFIYQEKFMWCKEDIATVSYIPVDDAGTRGCSKVHHMVFDFLPEDVVVLASCKGLVCCRSTIPSEKKPVIYVCNPSNREWIKLDWPPSGYEYDRNESIALAFDFDPSKDSIDSLNRFKLVRVKQIENSDDLYFTFELYSSEGGAWWKSEEICRCDNRLVNNKGIYTGGVLHWLMDGDQVLTFDVEKELAWLISVPVPGSEFRIVPEACIGESEGRLNYVQASEEGIHVWYLEDYYEFKWTLSHCKSLDEIERECPRFFFNLKNRVLEQASMDFGQWMNPMAFKDGIMLMKIGPNFYLYDTKNNKMAKACSFQDLNSQCMFNPTVHAHSLSLIPLRRA